MIDATMILQTWRARCLFHCNNILQHFIIIRHSAKTPTKFMSVNTLKHNAFSVYGHNAIINCKTPESNFLWYIHVSDIKIQTDLNADFNKADLVVSMTVTARQTEKSAKAKLILSDITEVAETEILLVEGKNPAVHMTVDAPMLWSAEEPNLNSHSSIYTLELPVCFRLLLVHLSVQIPMA